MNGHRYTAIMKWRMLTLQIWSISSLLHLYGGMSHGGISHPEVKGSLSRWLSDCESLMLYHFFMPTLCCFAAHHHPAWKTLMVSNCQATCSVRQHEVLFPSPQIQLWFSLGYRPGYRLPVAHSNCMCNTFSPVSDFSIIMFHEFCNFK